MEVDVDGWVAAYPERCKQSDNENFGNIQDANSRLMAAQEAVRELMFEIETGSTANFLLHHLKMVNYYTDDGVDIVSSVVIPYKDLMEDEDGENVIDYLEEIESESAIHLMCKETVEGNTVFEVVVG